MSSLNKTEQQILLRAAEILSDKAHWRQGAYGNWYLLQDEPSVCALGAVRRATAETYIASGGDSERICEMLRPGSEANTIFHSVSNALRKTAGQAVPTVNDCEGYEAVRNLFCKAIKEHCDGKE